MRIVIKIGTSTLTHASGHLNIRRVEALCKTISDIRNAGHEVILVSSGAIGMGVSKLGLKKRPDDMPTKQAAAAVGQCELMYIYDKLFGEYHHTVSQLLITGDDMRSEQRHQNFTNTLDRLLALGAMPIINENDTVATDEIGIGDNDTLAAIVAKSVRADLLVLLSDIDGLYTADPHKDPDAVLLRHVTEINDEVRALAGVSGSGLGTGGMITKLQAAELCLGCGCTMVIANGERGEVLYDILDGKEVGTRFSRG
jgi:glutamate 5-kinase